MTVQGLKLLACNGCTAKTEPYRTITIALKHAEAAGWTVLKHEGHRAMHFCPRCSRERAARVVKT